MEIHPWNEERWRRLVERTATLSHALLFTGPPGLGKNALAERLAGLLLCVPGRGAPCGRCRDCELFIAGSHPDFHVLSPESIARHARTGLFAYGKRHLPERPKSRKKDSTVVRVDQVRALTEALQGTAMMARHKVAVISPADAMNVNAANSLLKLLEEPSPDTTLILVSAHPAHLAATIRSRCVRIEFRPPSRELAAAWLAEQLPPGSDPAVLLDLAGGAPLAAKAFAGEDLVTCRDEVMATLEQLAGPGADPVAAAARWRELGPEPALTWLQRWVVDLIRTAAAGDPPALFNPDRREGLHATAEKLNLKRLYGLLDAVSEARRGLDGPLDTSLLLEEVLVRWTLLNRT